MICGGIQEMRGWELYCWVLHHLKLEAGDTSAALGCERVELYVTQHSLSMLYGGLNQWV